MNRPRSNTSRSGTTPHKKHKYIFVFGGVMSGVGKGIAASSMGTLLEGRGFKVNIVKVDPYLNVDAGTMNPTEHGEVFVLKSGLETDQDMGNYERFLNRDLTPDDYMTGGMVYQSVIERERALGYGGKCVEAIPHVRDEIMRRFKAAAHYNASDVSIIEIGGTVGDFQNALFIEAARVMKMEHPENVAFVMVSYLPVPGTLGEMKTKPTQSAVRELNGYGVQPDMIIARSTAPIDARRKEKLAIACNVRPEAVVSAPDVASIYDVPLNFAAAHVDELLLDLLHVKPKQRLILTKWKKFVTTMRTAKREVKIAVAGKYFDTGDFVLSDAYLSVIEAIKYSAYTLGLKPTITWINTKDIESGAYKLEDLKKFDGIIVPGGFGETGVEGKIKVARYAREHKIPYFGLCYGLHMLLIEYARNVLGLKDAHTTEIDPKTKNPVVLIMPEQRLNVAEKRYGGTMRLGHYIAKLKKGTIARAAYGVDEVDERHRHRYEVNPEYIKQFEDAGIVFSGVSPSGVLMEIAELPKSVHPFMVGVQFHPELQARPLDPHPLFTEFLKVAVKK